MSISCVCPAADCADCFSSGTKIEWPELKGVKGKEAMQKIMNDNKLVTPVLIGRKMSFPSDHCCGRVFLKVDSNDANPEALVFVVPRVG
ncbi:uncharacterized protein LOC122070613 [Macadamia integrifolia]|uniref:uncharacterized protein LOC122070613 n=1 Tax=Macadamia integrifolia TaxID=60698 RepID=UPI001C4F0BC5|nr:uncharacterized protein LOC122070613 [Macadamia integrifolia]